MAFQVEDWGQAAQHLQEEQIEFFVGDARGFSSDENYRVQLLGYRGGCFFCRQGHPLTALPQIRLADLLGYPRIGVRLPDVPRKILTEIAGQADFQMDVECAQLDVALRVVSSSDGTGMAPLEAVAEPIQRGELVRLRIVDMPPAEAALRLQYGIVSRAGYSLSPAARTMIEVLVATDRRLLT
ncbi:LysR substrate binding domain protein [compost metagenome]